ncbi:uncharacterized protein EV420DRAFT_1633884 [Desarmillaria tabescens]|uniref:Uncharacterized protein n=1 Tax=Armillaria tabescens TaxID=1929756 RepID=A0AA39NPM8_ARMTA|nr:uncharacterized protein EV420DRAFT_1633884 [Desarmillaria tabescens]KAK0469461.1 hypothetical protein EV420DRAFT_1633884 [Desarmillaria tabescens]
MVHHSQDPRELRSVAKRTLEEPENGGQSKKPKILGDEQDTDQKVESNSKTTPNSNPKTTPMKPSALPSKEVVDFAVTGVQLPVEVTALPGVSYYGVDVDTGEKVAVGTVPMKTHCAATLSKIKRILSSYILMPSYPTLSNIFTSNPKDFQLNVVGRNSKNKSWHIGTTESDSHTATFYVTGRILQSNLTLDDDTKTISIHIIERFWPQIAAFIAEVANVDILAVPMKDGGLCFSTYKKGIVDYKSSKCFPRKGDHGLDVRSWKSNVPAFDGCANFRLKDYFLLPKLRGGEIAQYSTAVIIFTISKFKLKHGMRIGFNVQSVVALVDWVSADWTKDLDPKWHESMMDESALGVTHVVDYDFTQDDEDEGQPSDEDDSDVGVL